MATIETNEAQRIGSAVREAMIEDVLPIVQERPAAVIGDREPVGMGWLRDLPDFRDYTSESATDRAAARGDRHRAAEGALARAREGRPPAVLLAGRGPGPAGLVHGERGRRARRVLRTARARQAHRRVAALPLQGDARPAPLDGRHRRVPALDDGRARAVRRPAGGVLAVQRHRVRHRAQRVVLRVRARTSARSRTSASTGRNDAVGAPDEDQGGTSPPACRRCSGSPSTARSRRRARRDGSRIRARATR